MNNKVLGRGALFVVIVILIVAVMQVISGAIIMFLSNIILDWLDKRTMPLSVGIAISILLTIVGATLRQAGNKSE